MVDVPAKASRPAGKKITLRFVRPCCNAPGHLVADILDEENRVWVPTPLACDICGHRWRIMSVHRPDLLGDWSLTFACLGRSYSAG